MSLDSAGKILIIRFSSLGDIILTTPVIRALKRKYPEKTFDFLVLESYKEVVNNNKYLNEIITYNKKDSLNNLINKLKENNYDYIIDLQNNFRSRKICKSLNIKFVSYKKPSIKKFLYVKFKYPPLEEISIPERYIYKINEIELDNEPPEFFFSNNSKNELELPNNLISLCPGSKHFTKQWPEKYYVELAGMLLEKGYRVALLGGKDDKEICERISKSNDNILNFAGENNLNKIAHVMKNSKVVVCNDSGLMHLSTAVKTPVFVFFGSTVTNFGFSPYNSCSFILEDNSLNCRPCSHIGRSSCPKNHFKCMNNLTPEIAYRNLEKFILTLEAKKN